MTRTRSLQPLILCALALALLASAASAQTLTPSPSSVSLNYLWYSETAPSAQTSITASADGTTYTAVDTDTWVTLSYTGTAGTVAADTLTISIVPSAIDLLGLPPGSYTSTVNLQIAGVTVNTVGVTLTVPVSPLSSSASPVALSYVLNGVANQSAATLVSTIHDTNASADNYSVVAGYPNWLSVTPATGHASSSAPDSCTFTVVQSNANSLSTGVHTITVRLHVAGQSDLPITVSLTVYAQQPLTTATTALNFAYTIGGTVPVAQTAAIKVATGSQAFTLDQSTVPVWLSVTPTSATANNGSGATISFNPASATASPVVKGLAAGNYNASVGFIATGSPSGSELTIPVVLTVSNPSATLSYKGAASTSATLNFPGATIPTPVVTVISSDEPTSFTATCTVTSTNPAYVNTPTSCVLAGASAAAATVTGIAYTYGTALTTTFDSALFSYTVFGAVITETVTITGGAHAPVSQTFIYTVQPVAPTFTALSPTSAAQMLASSDSLVVTLTGTNFVGPGSILNNAISQTKVYVGSTDVTADSVVINPTTMVVSIPGADFPAYATGKTTANMVLGLANQVAATAPTAPVVTQTLLVTNAPVVYAVTSTATYLQPAPGVKPKVVPYELVSIFGANFGMTGSVMGTLSSYYQYGTSVTSGTGTNAVTLSVSFKAGTASYKAPILFANATQINLAVPAELAVGSATVTVTAGTASSDGLFAVTVAASDPGIFTLSSQGVGAGAILNHDYSVNAVGNAAAVGSNVSIYMTGLGIPTSAGVDEASNTACVAINGTTSNPGYLQVVNTANPHATPPYTPPSPTWTSLDGAAINAAILLGSSLPPCFTALPTVTFTPVGGGSGTPGTATYAGFVSGSVAGLYQVNVTVPSIAAGSYYVTVGSSPSGVVTIQLQ